MPRSTKFILNHAEELAKRFEDYEPTPGEGWYAPGIRELLDAIQAEADAAARLGTAVREARAAGHSWAAIGGLLGTSGEAARQKYGRDNPAA